MEAINNVSLEFIAPAVILASLFVGYAINEIFGNN